jgi:hypothetical protein
VWNVPSAAKSFFSPNKKRMQFTDSMAEVPIIIIIMMMMDQDRVDPFLKRDGKKWNG